MVKFIHDKFAELVVETCHKAHIERHGLEDEEHRFSNKKEAIKELVKREVLQVPTQAMMSEWYDVPHRDYQRLIDHGKWMSIKYTWETMACTVEQECHAVSAYYWSLHPETTLYTGFSDYLHAHSWILKPNKTLLEPTPILRDVYFGFAHPEPEEFVKDEVQNILRLIDSGLLSLKHRPHFEAIKNIA